ncbi:MAG TPA: FdrA family protein [Streptosporangiales bacterium]
MGTVHIEVRRGAYHDSVTLMWATRALTTMPIVDEAQVVMATPLNLELLAERHFDVPGGLGPTDLVIAFRLGDAPEIKPSRAVRFALGTVDEVLAARTPDAGPGTDAPAAHTTGGVLAATAGRDKVPLAFVAVPGEYAFAEAMDAVKAGVSVMVFSDNVPVEQEILLKDEAARRGVLVMGPDCGTAIIEAAGLGFASTPEAGPVSIVAASGTGAQHLVALLQVPGMGARHVLGVGSRDLSARVRGRSTRQALDALFEEGESELIVVLTKPPDPEVLDELRGYVAGRRPAVMWAPVGPGEPDLTEVAERVLRSCGWSVPKWPQWHPLEPLERRPGLAVRGLFCGGTLATEAAAVMAGAGLPPDRLDVVDFGDDAYTRGRAHPMIDPSLRNERLARVAADPAVGVAHIDVVLGHGSHPDPAADLVPVVEAARADVVVTLVGMTGDPQGLDETGRALAMAGAHVFSSNAQAARHAAALVRERDRR